MTKKEACFVTDKTVRLAETTIFLQEKNHIRNFFGSKSKPILQKTMAGSEDTVLTEENHTLQ